MTITLIVATALVGVGCLAGALACLSAQRGISLRAESRAGSSHLAGAEKVTP